MLLITAFSLKLNLDIDFFIELVEPNCITSISVEGAPLAPAGRIVYEIESAGGTKTGTSSMWTRIAEAQLDGFNGG